MVILKSGYAFWNPLIWVIALATVVILALYFRSRGQKNYKKGTEQTKIFLCGEDVPEPELRHIKASNVYWGFFETLKGYYDAIVKPQTGIINDLALWFVLLLAIGTIVILATGAGAVAK